MRLYAGCDLHAKSNYWGIVDGEGKRVFKKKVGNDGERILGMLEGFRGDLEGVVVESTFNWYWLVDLLMDEGYRVYLANPTKMQKYSGLKYGDDEDDAFWLAEMLRLGILPVGYIYPKESRPMRDLLRKRAHLVRMRTSALLSWQNILSRNVGGRGRRAEEKGRKLREWRMGLLESEDLVLAGRVSEEVVEVLGQKIREVEGVILERVMGWESYGGLLSLPGVGKVLGLTILLETGPVGRFADVGHYVSYCRKVPSQWLSDGKRKGQGNRRNGNRYLAWAFSEAAELARRFHAEPRAYYQRKMAQTNAAVAHSALAHKLARVAYYILRDGVRYDPQKLFGGSWAGAESLGGGLAESHAT
jgi:transposase